MRVIMLFYMDDKFSNYKIDPDNQMYFMDITGLASTKSFRQNVGVVQP